MNRFWFSRNGPLSRRGRPRSFEEAGSPPSPGPAYLEDVYYDDPVAFEGAMGFGANATGGRGDGTLNSGANPSGTMLYEVTNLNDTGVGSLRAALEATEKRVIVPKVSGWVSIPNEIDPTGNFTFLGQLSPGGIGVRPTLNEIDHEMISMWPASNAIMRYMTIRADTVDPLGAFSQGDGLRIRASTDVILDHLSLSYTTDEILPVTDSTGITVQDCIMAFPLTGDPEGDHEYVTLISGGPNQLTWARNLMSTSRDRTPEMYTVGTLQWVGNMAYNGRNKAVFFISTDQGVQTVDFVRNWYKQGTTWDSGEVAIRFRNKSGVEGLRSTVYMEGNDSEDITDPTVIADQTLMTRVMSPSPETSPPDARDPTEWVTQTPTTPTINGSAREMPTLPLEATAADFWTYIQANAGNVLFRDSVDDLAISQAVNNTGPTSMTDDVSVYGGFPAFTSGTYPTAADGVISDAWRTSTGETRDWYELDTAGTKRLIIENYADDIAQGRWVEP